MEIYALLEQRASRRAPRRSNGGVLKKKIVEKIAICFSF
jgi:hypothetical protein